MNATILEHILHIRDTLPKRQKQLCNYILVHFSEVHMMTVAELAKAAGVGAATVMRLIVKLNLQNYNAFKKELYQASLLKNQSSYGDMKRGFAFSQLQPMVALWQESRQVIDTMVNPLNMQRLNQLVQMLLDAKRVNLLGLRMSKAPAIYFECMVGRFLPKLQQLSNESDFVIDKIFHMEQGDMMLVFSIWPCTKKTVEACRLCYQKNIPLALITNTILNPIAKYATLTINTDAVDKNVGMLPSMMIVEALISELGRRTSPESTEKLERLEAVLDSQYQFVWEQ